MSSLATQAYNAISNSINTVQQKVKPVLTQKNRTLLMCYAKANITNVATQEKIQTVAQVLFTIIGWAIGSMVGGLIPLLAIPLGIAGGLAGHYVATELFQPALRGSQIQLNGQWIAFS